MAGIRQVAVVTESVACLPEEEVASLEVAVIPVPFQYAGREYLDGVDITSAEFFRMLRPELPPALTSTPSPGAYMETFRHLCRAGYEVLCISPSLSVTRMHETAALGRSLVLEEGVEERIEVVDCGTAAMAQGFLVREAARLAKNGAEMEEVIERVRALSGFVSLVVTLDTLEYLAKTHRIPRINALVGKAMQIKPVVLFAGGTVKPLEKPRARRRAVRRLLDFMGGRLHGGMPLHVSVQHADAREEAEALMESVAERFRPQELSINEFSPVMGSYTGPGLLGLAFYEDPDDMHSRGELP